MKCVVASVIIPEKVGGYSVLFPDIAGGTSGETLYEALEMAEDAANGMFMTAENRGKPIQPTPPEQVVVPEGAFMTLIKVDTDAYRKNL